MLWHDSQHSRIDSLRSLEQSTLALVPCSLVVACTLVGASMAYVLAGTLAGCMFALGSSCHIECGEPMMGRCIFDSSACRLVESIEELVGKTSFRRTMTPVGSSFEAGTQLVHEHRCKLAHKSLS